MDALAGHNLAAILAMVAAAAFVQGYSGFGFGIIATTLLAFLNLAGKEASG